MHYGWRMAFPLVALLWTGPAFLLALFCFFDRRPAGQSKLDKADQAKDAAPLAKPDMRRVFLSGTFIRLAHCDRHCHHSRRLARPSTCLRRCRTRA